MLQFIHGNLVDQEVDAIVNCWNMNLIPWWLLVPQGVSGSIKRRAGTLPFKELRRAGLLTPGSAFLTGAGKLKCKSIIHVAALNCLWMSSPEIVENCTVSALQLAVENGFQSLAFPLIGAGTGGVNRTIAEEIISRVISQSQYTGDVTIVRFR